MSDTLTVHHLLSPTWALLLWVGHIWKLQLTYRKGKKNPINCIACGGLAGPKRPPCMSLTMSKFLYHLLHTPPSSQQYFLEWEQEVDGSSEKLTYNITIFVCCTFLGSFFEEYFLKVLILSLGVKHKPVIKWKVCVGMNNLSANK